jgi:2-iminobutanoate/2-iminopropanoate deaminase
MFLRGLRGISTPDAPRPLGPYSQGIRSGDFVYLAGQIGLDENSELSDGVAAQAEQALRNVGAVLRAAGCDYRNVVRASLFLTDMANFGAVNAVYERYFQPPFPARTTLCVSALPGGALVEIDCIASVDE